MLRIQITRRTVQTVSKQPDVRTKVAATRHPQQTIDPDVLDHSLPAQMHQTFENIEVRTKSDLMGVDKDEICLGTLFDPPQIVPPHSTPQFRSRCFAFSPKPWPKNGYQ